MRRLKNLAPAFILTAALTPACGGSTPPPEEPHMNPPGPAEPEPEHPVNPPGPGGEPGVGDGATPPGDDDAADDDDDADDDSDGDPDDD